MNMENMREFVWAILWNFVDYINHDIWGAYKRDPRAYMISTHNGYHRKFTEECCFDKKN